MGVVGVHPAARSRPARAASSTRRSSAAPADGDTVAIGGGRAVRVARQRRRLDAARVPERRHSSAMYIPNPDTVYVGMTDGRVFRTTWNGAAWTALDGADDAAGGRVRQRHVVDPANPNRIWATYTTHRRRPRLPVRRRRRRPGRTAPPACPTCRSTRSRSIRGTRTASGSRPTSASTRASTPARRWATSPTRCPNCVHRRPAVPPARPGAARRHAQPRRVGDPGRRVDDRSRRAACSGRARLPGNADAALVHVQLARDLAHHLDGDADDAAPGRAAGARGTSRSSGRARSSSPTGSRCSNLTPDPRDVRGPLLHPQPLLTERNHHVDQRSVDRNPRPECERPMVHLRAGRPRGTSYWYMMPTTPLLGAPSSRLGRRRRARRREHRHLLDHRHEPHLVARSRSRADTPSSAERSLP